jgi:hypothetical protein
VNDPKWIGGIMGEGPRLARALIRRLIEAGKLIEVDGTLDNLRARKEREISLKTSRNSSERSANAARVRWSNKENQSLSDASSNASRARVLQPHLQDTPPNGGGRAPKGTRLPVDWLLPLDDEAWALAQGMTREKVQATATKFKNYWLAKSGKDATKIDWSRTWQNWVLTDIERTGKPNGTGPPQKPRSTSAQLSAFCKPEKTIDHDFGERPSGIAAAPVRAIPDRRG